MAETSFSLADLLFAEAGQQLRANRVGVQIQSDFDLGRDTCSNPFQQVLETLSRQRCTTCLDTCCTRCQWLAVRARPMVKVASASSPAAMAASTPRLVAMSPIPAPS